MSKFEKTLARLRQNPKNVRYEELENILINIGFVKRQGGTSHVVFYMPGEQYILLIPKKKPFLLPVYVKQVLQILEEMGYFENE